MNEAATEGRQVGWLTPAGNVVTPVGKRHMDANRYGWLPVYVPACVPPYAREDVMVNGLTESETSATASVAGLTQSRTQRHLVPVDLTPKQFREFMDSISRAVAAERKACMDAVSALSTESRSREERDTIGRCWDAIARDSTRRGAHVEPIDKSAGSVDFQARNEQAAWPAGLIDRVKAAEARIRSNQCPRRIPADPTDVDLVLAEVRLFLEGSKPPFWVEGEATPPTARL